MAGQSEAAHEQRLEEGRGLPKIADSYFQMVALVLALARAVAISDVEFTLNLSSFNLRIKSGTGIYIGGYCGGNSVA